MATLCPGAFAAARSSTSSAKGAVWPGEVGSSPGRAARPIGIDAQTPKTSPSSNRVGRKDDGALLATDLIKDCQDHFRAAVTPHGCRIPNPTTSKS
jgi:hypothetical protein